MLKTIQVATLDSDFRIFWSERWQCYFLWKPSAGYYKLQLEAQLFEFLKRERLRSGSFAKWCRENETAYRIKWMTYPKVLGTLNEGDDEKTIETLYEIRQTFKATPTLTSLVNTLFDGDDNGSTSN